MADKKVKKARKINNLGTGLLGKAAKAQKNRTTKVDNAVNKALGKKKRK